MSFAHLHLHSTFSFLDGYGLPEQYISRCKEIGQRGFAVTDHGSIFSHRPFYTACRKAGLKFVPGCEMYLDGEGEKYYHITVLAKTNEGYGNLCKLVSMSNDPEHFHMRPTVTLREMATHSDGLIFLSGCFGDGIPHRAWKKNPELVLGELLKMKRALPELYVEVQQINREEREVMRAAAAVAGLKCVATLDCHYPRREDYPAEDLALCIGNKSMMGAVGRMQLTDNLWMMSEKEALEYGFTPDELSLADQILGECNVELPQLQPLQIPHARQRLIEAVASGAKRLGSSIQYGVYRHRYLYELDIIDKLGLHSYFVVMGNVVNEFKSQGVLVGPARGSAAGSLICYLIGITEVDPIRYGLSFERFMDINRKDFPDIDTDFPHSSIPSVVEFLGKEYGRENIGRLCSFSTYRGNQVFWDIARAYGVDRSVAKAIGKAIPRLVNDEVDMQDIVSIPEVAAVIRKFPMLGMATALEGQVRQLGQHASGYAISPTPLPGVVGVVRAPGGDGRLLSVDKDNAEAMGLLKLDILSLNTLDMLQAVMSEVSVRPERLYRMDPVDPKVFAAFNKGLVSGIFQFEGGAVRRALETLEVETLDDLAFINAVARPGASNALTGDVVVPDVLKQFIYKGKYFVYQEELMAILRFLGFDWDEVTKFRKLVSKKKVTELAGLFKEKFMRGMTKHTTTAESYNFWAVINKCGEYMFNKCISGDTLINRGRAGWWPISKLYRIKNDRGYAIANGHKSLHTKLNREGWGKTLSVDTDDRIRPDNIVDIVYSGIKRCFRLVDTTGRSVTASADHRFLTPVGWKRVEEILPGHVVFVAGEYEDCSNKYNFYKEPMPLNSKKGCQGFTKRSSGHSVVFKKIRQAMLDRHGRTCMRCGRAGGRIETAHLDGNRENNSADNLMNMCPGCHKKHDYGMGRAKQFSKGLPLMQAVIVTKECVGEIETYDIEMEGETHNFIANGFVSHNSHAVSYALLGYWSMWLKLNHRKEFVKSYMNMVDSDMKRREMLRECLRDGWQYSTYQNGGGTGFTVGTGQDNGGRPRVVGGLLSIKGIGEAKAKAILNGRIDKSSAKAIQGSLEKPEEFAPWAALDDFGNRHRIGNLPEGEITVVARVWDVKDGRCVIEDVHGAEKAYFSQSHTTLESGRAYRLAVTKFKYVHIDSAKELK